MAKKSEKTEIAVTTFDIAKELWNVTQKIIEQDGELQPGDLESLQQWQAAIETKAENIAWLKIRLEKEAETYKAVEEKARQLRKARESASERIRKYLAECMKVAGVKSIKKEGGVFSASLVDGRVSAQIDDQNKIPLEFVTIVEVVQVDKDKVKKALEEKRDVPGAHLEQGESYVMIR